MIQTPLKKSLVKLLLTSLTCLSGVAHAQHFSSKNKSLDENFWADGRSWIQHLSALELAPKEWTSLISEVENKQAPSSFEGCLKIDFQNISLAETCSSLALKECRNDYERTKRIDSSRLERVTIFSALIEKNPKRVSWSTWLRLASIQVLAGDFNNALRLTDFARNHLDNADENFEWIGHRLNVYADGLKYLQSNKPKSSASLPAITTAKVSDQHTQFLSNKLRTLSLDYSDLDADVRELKTSEEKLVELARKRWMLKFDRIEIDSLRSQILKLQFDLETLRRIDSLAVQHNFTSPEWKAIVSVVSGISAQIEFISRNEGLTLPLEVWVSRTDDRADIFSIDDDKKLWSSQLLMNEYINSLAQLVNQISLRVTLPEEVAQVKLLGDRLAGMVAPIGTLLNTVPVRKNREQALQIRRQLKLADARIRSLLSQQAAFDFLQKVDESSVYSSRNFSEEIRALQSERQEILKNYFADSLNVLALSTAQTELLVSRTTQLKKTLSDLRVVARGIDNRTLEGTQAGYYFSESQRFLDRIEGESLRSLKEKKSQAKSLSDAARKIERDVANLKSDLTQFLVVSASQLRPQFLKILSAMEQQLHKRERALEFQEQVAQGEIRDRIATERRVKEWSRDRLNDSRRIRSENIEWRTGR